MMAVETNACMTWTRTGMFFMDGGTGPGCSRNSCHKPGAFAETGYNYTGEVTGYQQDWRSLPALTQSTHSAQ